MFFYIKAGVYRGREQLIKRRENNNQRHLGGHDISAKILKKVNM